jgi:hypothetical protein
MASKLIYTFRTFRHKDVIDKPFIFGNLKKDLASLQDLLIVQRPKYIIGVANTNSFSRIEPVAVNIFSKNKKVSKDGPDEFRLFIPKFAPFATSDKYTTSFCNWTMYKIARFIDSNGLDTKLIFVHVNSDDIGGLLGFIDSL